MNSKLVLGFLGGLLAATVVLTGVFYVQVHKTREVQAPEAPVAATVVAVAPLAPFPEVPVAAPAPKPLPVKTQVKAIEQVKVEAPPEPEPVSAAPVFVPDPPPPPTPPPPPPPLPTVEITPEPPQPRSVTIANGTLLIVRLGETLSSDRNRPGDTFVGVLDQPMVIDGLVIAEKGAPVNGRIVDALEAGRVKGLAHLSLELTSLVTSDNQTIDLRTARFEKAGPASKAEDVQRVGIGAAIGAAIGAIAGGGKGAAIGAASGGAAGVGIAAATRGKPAVLPAETQISFRVDLPIMITEKR